MKNTSYRIVNLILALAVVCILAGCSSNTAIYNRGQACYARMDYDGAQRNYAILLERRNLPDGSFDTQGTLANVQWCYAINVWLDGYIKYKKGDSSGTPQMDSASDSCPLEGLGGMLVECSNGAAKLDQLYEEARSRR